MLFLPLNYLKNIIKVIFVNSFKTRKDKVFWYTKIFLKGGKRHGSVFIYTDTNTICVRIVSTEVFIGPQKTPV